MWKAMCKYSRFVTLHILNFLNKFRLITNIEHKQFHAIIYAWFQPYRGNNNILNY